MADPEKLCNEWPIMDRYEEMLNLSRTVASRYARPNSFRFEELTWVCMDRINRLLATRPHAARFLRLYAARACLDRIAAEGYWCRSGCQARRIRSRGNSPVKVGIADEYPSSDSESDPDCSSLWSELAQKTTGKDRQIALAFSRGAKTFHEAVAASGSQTVELPSDFVYRCKKALSRSA